MLTVVTFKWRDPQYGGVFKSEHVNVLRSMVKRHYDAPHRFVCFTDDPDGLDGGVEALPIWDDHANVANPTGGGRPSCYRRLKLFDPAMRDVLGERFVCMDVDAVITGDLKPLWDRPEDVVMWKSPTGEWPYNGAMFMANAGARPEVWTDFDPVESPRKTHKAGYRGSDQAWMSYRLGWGEATWTQERDGVWFLNPSERGRKPANARIVFTTGRCPPWKAHESWIKEAYR